MKNYIVRYLKKLKRIPSLLFSHILFVVAATITIVWITTSSAEALNVVDGFYEMLAAAVLGLLGVAITSYIFLHDTMQNKAKKAHMKSAIDQLQKSIRKTLTYNCIIGLIAFILCLVVYYDNTYPKAGLIVLSTFAYFSIVWLIELNVSIINYNKVLLGKTVQLLNEKRKELGNSLNWKTAKPNDETCNAFFKASADVQKILRKLMSNHIEKTSGTLEKKAMEAILLLKTSNTNEAADLAHNCVLLTDYTDLLLVLSELTSDESTEIPIDLPLSVESRLIKSFVSGEIIGGIGDEKGISVSSKTYEDGRFDGTSFANSLFFKVTFKGHNQTLERASFMGSKLIDVSFECQGKMLGINFTNVAFVRVLFPSRKAGCRLELCNFRDADFSKQEQLIDVDFRSSVFHYANFAGDNNFRIEDVSFELTDCSDASFHNIRINNVRFVNANLTASIFTYSKAIQCNMAFSTLESAVLFQAHFEQCNFSNCRIAKANFIEAIIVDCNFNESYCNYVSFQHSRISGQTTFEMTVLTEADFSHAEINDGVDFKDAICTRALFIQTIAKQVSFRNVSFANAQLLHGRYSECIFEDALFDDAMINSVLFCKCDFTNCSFRGAILKKVIFCDCTGLIPELFESSILDKETKFQLGMGCGKTIVKHSTVNAFVPDSVLSDFDAIVRERRSTRKFKSEVIFDNNIFRAILDSARLAPSAKNRQPWHFYLYCTRKEIEGIANLLLTLNSNKIMDPNSIEALRSSSAVIFVGHIDDGDPKHEKPDLQSIGASIENLILKATSMNIDSLWMCDPLAFENELTEYLQLEHRFVAVILLGLREEKQRNNLDDIVTGLS